MKKLSIKVITMMMAIICMFFVIAVPTSASYITYSDWKYTCETNTVGKSIAIFSGMCPDNILNGYMSLYSYCEGGPADSFNTAMTSVIRNTENTPYRTIAYDMFSTEENGGRTFECSLDVVGYDCPWSAIGSSYQTCTSYDNPEDNWTASYMLRWSYEYDGWLEN